MQGSSACVLSIYLVLGGQNLRLECFCVEASSQVFKEHSLK